MKRILIFGIFALILLNSFATPAPAQTISDDTTIQFVPDYKDLPDECKPTVKNQALVYKGELYYCTADGVYEIVRGSSATRVPSMAMRCLASTGHINHGFFWEPGKEHHDFFWDAKVRPWGKNQLGYLISAGYGGDHALLWGFESNDTHFRVTGNVQDGQTVITNSTFQTEMKFPLGDWYNLGVGFDSFTGKIVLYVNGIAEGFLNYPYQYRLVNGVGTANLYVCGSNHSKFDMDLAWLRGFENQLPFNISLGKPYRSNPNPQASYYDGGVYTNAVFLADYTRPAFIIPDISEGFSTGTLQRETTTVVTATVTAGNGKSVVTANGMPNSPKTVSVPLAGGETAAQVATAFRNALHYDKDVGGFFLVGGTDADIKLTARLAQTNDSTMNFTVENDTSGGITDNTTSTDTRAGYLGRSARHPGIREGLIGTSGAFIDSNATNESENQFPTWKSANFSTPAPHPETPPSGSPLFYDTFSNRNNPPFYSNTGGLGNSEGGSVGVKPWGCAASAYLTSAGSAAYGLEGYGSPACLPVGVTDYDVTFNFSGSLNAYVRYADANNNVAIQAIGTSLTVTKTISGTPTTIYYGAFVGAPGGVVRVIANGNNIKVYSNNVLRSDSMTALPTGGNIAFGLTSYGGDFMNRIVGYAP